MAKQKYCETLQPGFYLREEIYKILRKEFEG